MKKNHLLVKSIFLVLVTLLIFACDRNKKSNTDMYFYQDFEHLSGWTKMYVTDEIKGHSGSFTNRVDEQTPYSVTCALKNPRIKKIKVSAWCYFSNVDCKGSLCVNVTDKAEQSKQWESAKIEEKIKSLNTWTKIYLYVVLNPEAISADNTISIFVMNNNKEKFFVDDFEVQLAE